MVGKAVKSALQEFRPGPLAVANVDAALSLYKVLEAALSCNASRVVLAHNHVSGVAIPSQADVDIC